ncbi:13806_t:CDS:2, partial [Gigaspora margarita]
IVDVKVHELRHLWFTINYATRGMPVISRQYGKFSDKFIMQNANFRETPGN